MNRLPQLHVGFILSLLLLAGCAVPVAPAAQAVATPTATLVPPPPTSTPAPPTPTPHPFEGLAEWDVVVIGDSTLWGVAGPYARLIEGDRKVKVNLHDEWTGALSAGVILKTLGGEFEHSLRREKWPQLIRDAEVLVLFGNPIDSLSPELTEVAWSCVSMTDPGDVTLPDDAFKGYRADLSAIYEKIGELRDGRPLILRATGIYNPVISLWREKGFDDTCVAFWEGQNVAARQAAEEHGIQFVDTYAAFNGPDHSEDPRAKGYIRADGEHPSESGAQFYAELLQRSGYSAWIPNLP